MAAKSQPCHGYTCILHLGLHGAVRLLHDDQRKPKKMKDDAEQPSKELESLGPPLHITAVPLIANGRGAGDAGAGDAGAGDAGAGDAGAGVITVVAPTALGYSVYGSENSQFPRYIEAFIHMVESSECLTSSDIVSFFNSFDDKMYSFFDNRFDKQFFRELQDRFSARVNPEDLEKVDFTKNFVTFARTELSKCDVNTRMQMIRTSAGLKFAVHNACIATKEYSPGTNANECTLYFPSVNGELHHLLRERVRRERPKFGETYHHVSIKFSSDKKVVLTIKFDTDGDGVVTNKLWRGITLNMFFEKITQYLKFVFKGVEGFDLDVLMSRTCVIDTACANFHVPGRYVTIISFDNSSMGRVEGEGGSMLIDVHNDPTAGIGWWESNINPPPRPAPGAVTHSRHRLIIPSDLMSYVPIGLISVDMIKSVEPIFDPETGLTSVTYQFYDGRSETIAHQPQSSGAATDSMEGVCGSLSPKRDSQDAGGGGGGGGSLGRRNLLRDTRRGRSLRNKSKKKRNKKIRGLGVRWTRRKRTCRTLRRR